MTEQLIDRCTMPPHQVNLRSVYVASAQCNKDYMGYGKAK